MLYNIVLVSAIYQHESVIKSNKLELVVLMLVVLRWMSLETVTQSEVRKRKTILIHIYGI